MTQATPEWPVVQSAVPSVERMLTTIDALVHDVTVHLAQPPALEIRLLLMLQRYAGSMVFLARQAQLIRELATMTTEPTASQLRTHADAVDRKLFTDYTAVEIEAHSCVDRLGFGVQPIQPAVN